MLAKLDKKPSFTPVEFTITFHSQNEFNAFKEMVSFVQSVPGVVYPSNQPQRQLLSEMFNSMYEVFKNERNYDVQRVSTHSDGTP